MLNLTKEKVKQDFDRLPENYKTKDVDRLISHYVKEQADVSDLRDYVLEEPKTFHRIYYYVSLKQIKDVYKRMEFIHQNLYFEDWWHTDQLIKFVSDMDFDTAYKYAKEYVTGDDPFIRRWGYVMFISKLGRGHAQQLLPLLHDDEEYYVQMAQSWLIAELTISEPEIVLNWMTTNGLSYNINGKAIQKISDSFRITDEWKKKFKDLRAELKN